MEGARSGTEEAVRFETEVGIQARFAGRIVEAAQSLDFEVDQNLAVVGETGTAFVGKAVVAGHKVEERRNRTSFEVYLQMVFAVAAAGEDSLASQPCPALLVQDRCTGSPNDSHNCLDSDPSLGSDCLAPSH